MNVFQRVQIGSRRRRRERGQIAQSIFGLRIANGQVSKVGSDFRTRHDLHDAQVVASRSQLLERAGLVITVGDLGAVNDNVELVDTLASVLSGVVIQTIFVHAADDQRAAVAPVADLGQVNVDGEVGRGGRRRDDRAVEQVHVRVGLTHRGEQQRIDRQGVGSGATSN